MPLQRRLIMIDYVTAKWTQQRVSVAGKKWKGGGENGLKREVRSCADWLPLRRALCNTALLGDPRDWCIGVYLEIAEEFGVDLSQYIYRLDDCVSGMSDLGLATISGMALNKRKSSAMQDSADAQPFPLGVLAKRCADCARKHKSSSYCRFKLKHEEPPACVAAVLFNPAVGATSRTSVPSKPRVVVPQTTVDEVRNRTKRLRPTPGSSFSIKSNNSSSMSGGLSFEYNDATESLDEKRAAAAALPGPCDVAPSAVVKDSDSGGSGLHPQGGALPPASPVSLAMPSVVPSVPSVSGAYPFEPLSFIPPEVADTPAPALAGDSLLVAANDDPVDLFPTGEPSSVVPPLQDLWFDPLTPVAEGNFHTASGLF